MAITLQFYADAALTSPLSSATLTLDREIGGPTVDAQVFLGSTNAQRRFEAADGGPIQISVLDGVPGDGGFVPTDIALAQSQYGLAQAAAIPGAPLNINGGINGGVPGAVPIWLRFLGNSYTPKTSTDLALTTNTVKEFAA